MSDLRVVFWNILHGGGAARIAPIGLSLVQHRPDVVVLCEFRPARGGQLRAVLADHGLEYQTLDQRARLNTILIASRSPFELGLAPGSASWIGRWAEVTLVDCGVRVLGVHIPDDSRPDEKTRCWNDLVGWTKLNAGTPAIIVGDLNTARFGPDSRGLATGNQVMLAKLSTSGFTDAFRLLHPDAKDRSWESWTGESARIDAAIVSGSLAACVVGAEYDHGVRERGESDHSMLVLDLKGFARPGVSHKAGQNEGLFGHS